MNWLWLQLHGAAGQCFFPLNHHALLKLEQIFRRGNSFNLDVIGSWMRLPRMQQSCHQRRFVTQQQQTFGIMIQTPDGIDFFGKSKFSQCSLAGLFLGELAEDAVGFVESEEHVNWMVELGTASIERKLKNSPEKNSCFEIVAWFVGFVFPTSHD